MAGFFEGLTNFVKGLTGVSQATEGLTGSLSNNAENWAKGAGAVNDLNYSREYDQLKLASQKQQIALDRLTTVRGDNVQFYWAAAIGLGFGLVLLR